MKQVLFVCLGNICRSPAAEAVFNHLLQEKGLTDQIRCESAGTGGYHVGERPDPRMRAAGEKRGYKFLTLAQKFDATTDFDQFDYIIAMDDDNYNHISSLDSDGHYSHKLCKMISFNRSFPDEGIPDPYFGGDQGFEYVLDMLEEGCTHLLESMD